MKRHIYITLVAVPLMLSSCGLYTKYQNPDNTPLTAAYAQAMATAPDSTTLGYMPWQQMFTDPQLASLIEQALQANTSLANAKLNVDIAQAQLKGAKLAYLPSVALAPTAGGAINSVSKDWSWSYTIPAQVSWEIDAFGRLTNSKRSAEARLRQSRDYAQAVRSQIIAAVANTYYATAAVASQLELSKRTAVIWEQNVQTMRDFKLAGRVTEAAVVQSEANYYNILGSITDLEVKLDQLQNTMAVLLHRLPQPVQVSAEALANFTAPSIAMTEVPMSMLAARPDVAAAQESMAVAFYATQAARAAFYPSLSITANGGYTNHISTLAGGPAGWLAQLAGNLTAPIFSRGRNIAGLEAAKAQQQQALNTFEQTLLSAAGEVSDAMTAYQKSAEKARFVAKQIEALEKSVSITNDLLKYYNGTYLEVLTAQQSLLSAQMSLINTDLTRAQAAINLYQALGGGR